ncbi:hypothetical protein [Gordonia sputi]
MPPSSPTASPPDGVRLNAAIKADIRPGHTDELAGKFDRVMRHLS